jgi:hypothetical protein
MGDFHRTVAFDTEALGASIILIHARPRPFGKARIQGDAMFDHKVSPMRLDAKRTALVFTDLHNDFLAPNGKAFAPGSGADFPERYKPYLCGERRHRHQPAQGIQRVHQ